MPYVRAGKLGLTKDGLGMVKGDVKERDFEDVFNKKKLPLRLFINDNKPGAKLPDNDSYLAMEELARFLKANQHLQLYVEITCVDDEP